MKMIVFSDLDDTLFCSRRKVAPQKDFQALAYLENGEAISYASPKQQNWLAFWLQQALLIPVTARNSASFHRVAIDFPQHAVLNHGGLILNPDGKIDEDWLEYCRPLATQSQIALEALLARIPAALAMPHRWMGDAGMMFYVLWKNHHDAAALSALRTILEPHLGDDFWLHQQSHDVALLPRWLNKAAAVRYLQNLYRKRFPEAIFIGMGDSISDLDFMRCCDYIIAPRHCQWMNS